MQMWILTTILDGELTSTLHVTREDAERALLDALSEHGNFLAMEDVQPFFDEQGAGWNYQLTHTAPVAIDFSEFQKSMTLSEFDALWAEAQSRFGLAGTWFSREDVDSEMLDSDLKRKATDDEWDDIQATYEWSKGIPERLTERGWDLVTQAINEVIVVPTCDVCGLAEESMFGVEWCGECGCCREHCQGFTGCPDKEEEKA